jgi:hypothetical protein
MDSGMGTITAPGRVSRHVTTPILLPESDMACWLAVIAISPDGGVAAAGISVRCRRLPGTA